MIKRLKNKASYHPFWRNTFIILFFILIIFSIGSFFLSSQAQSEQNESKQTLMQVYRTLYSYKTENGTFPDTGGKSFTLNEMQELKPYFKSKNKLIKIKDVDLFVTSDEEQFNIILQKTLVNGDNDIQILNSKKEFCHKKDGVKHQEENCLNA